MRSRVAGQRPGGPGPPDRAAPGDPQRGRAHRLVRWWGLASYGVGGLTIAWGLLFTAVGLVSLLGEPGPGGNPVGTIVGSAISAAVGVVLLVVAIPVLLVGVVIVFAGRGARRGSKRWWLVGMSLYSLGGLLALAAGSLGGIAVLGGLVALGYAGRSSLV